MQYVYFIYLKGPRCGWVNVVGTVTKTSATYTTASSSNRGGTTVKQCGRVIGFPTTPGSYLPPEIPSKTPEDVKQKAQSYFGMYIQ